MPVLITHLAAVPVGVGPVFDGDHTKNHDAKQDELNHHVGSTVFIRRCHLILLAVTSTSIGIVLGCVLGFDDMAPDHPVHDPSNLIRVNYGRVVFLLLAWWEEVWEELVYYCIPS